MSRKGSGPQIRLWSEVRWDNAVAESFFKSLKTELIYHADYATKKQAKLAVFEYIEGWYNRKRRHSALGNRSPQQYQPYLEQERTAA
jgi:transposase InsO family protein